MEVATDEAATPIKQDTKKGKLRDYPYNIHWNYGMLPQTWEDPNVKNAACGGVSGDNDPVDVVEIGGKAHPTGSIVAVKVLGVYAMIDDGELDWKVIAIDAKDPRAAQVNDVADVERVFPGELEKVRVWFRDYKVSSASCPCPLRLFFALSGGPMRARCGAGSPALPPASLPGQRAGPPRAHSSPSFLDKYKRNHCQIPDGKPANKFGLDDRCMPKSYALDIIHETNEFYKNLRAGKTANDGLWLGA